MSFIRMLVGSALLLSLLALTGCSTFRVSQEDINKQFATQLAKTQENHLSLNLDNSAVNLDLLVNKANIDFTERDGGLVIVNLSTALKGTLKAFGQDFSLTSTVNPSFESGVRLKENKIYLVAPKITKIGVKGSGIKDKMLSTTLKSVQGQLEKVLATYFDEYPVYTLDHSPFEKASASLVKNITIKNDGVELGID